MNCLETQALLQRWLDGEPPPEGDALERHLALCPTCREQHGAAARLTEGLKLLPRPQPAPRTVEKLVTKVLEDRLHRREKMRRRVFVTMALAACLLFLLLVGYASMPAPDTHRPDLLPVVEGTKKSEPLHSATQAEQKQPEKTEPRNAETRNAEPRNALTALTERWADTTRNHARVVLVATNLDAVENLPAVNDLPVLDPGVREAGQDVSDGVRAVALNARRAFSFFARELPMPETEPKRN